MLALTSYITNQQDLPDQIECAHAEVMTTPAFSHSYQVINANIGQTREIVLTIYFFPLGIG